MLDACEGFVCQDDNAKVTVTFYANKGSGHPRGLDYQLYSLPAFAKQPLGMHPSKPTNIGGDEYQFIIDTNTLATGHFPPAGDYAIVVHVNVAGAGKPDQYAAATLHVRHCTPDELEKFRQFHRFMSIAQDVPASAVPTPSDVLSVGQSGAQIEVNLTAGASQNDVMNIAFFRASDGTPIPVTGPGTSTSFTIVQGSTSGAYVILTGNGITGPLDTAQDVVAVATVASSGNSTSCSFTVQ